MVLYAILIGIKVSAWDRNMSLFNRFFVIRIAVTAAVSLASAAFAQIADSTADKHDDIQRATDLMNLMRTVLDPNPAPLLASPAERAVSGKTSTDPASPVATTVPVVIMPNIEIPEEESGQPDKSDTDTQEPAQSAAAVSSSKKDADETDSDDCPPFYYVFFYGDYVPYFEGWYYYSDRWLWGRRWPAPPEPPGWIPPPPPPRPRPPDPVPGLLIPSVRTSAPDRTPESPETAAVPPRRELRLAPPHPHEKARTNRATRSRSCRNAIVSLAKTKRGANRCPKTPISRSRQVHTASQAMPPGRIPLRRRTAISRLHRVSTVSREATADFVHSAPDIYTHIRQPRNISAS